MQPKTDHSFESILIEWLRKIKPSSVLEWGPGKSTGIIHQECPAAKILSIESNAEYRKKMAAHHPYAEIIHAPIPEYGPSEYSCWPSLHRRGEKYDLIFVDGRQRASCLVTALLSLNAGGVIIIHDSERAHYQNALSLFDVVASRDFTSVLIPKGSRPPSPGKKLTIGMAVYDDFDGVFFTCQSIRMHHREVMDEIQLLVIDGNPSSEHGKATAHFCKGTNGAVQYVEAPRAYGSAQTKELVFGNANTPYVMCIDCHVLLESGSISKLLAYLENDDGNLLQGPMTYDDLVSISTHMEPIWRGGMKGIWANDARGASPDAPPFEIPAQGMGLFACRKDSWPGFNPLFRGFGAEECYIHEKFKQRGKKTICLPFLRWSHRFGRPSGIPYKCHWGDRVFNHFVGHIELGLDTKPVFDHFGSILSPDKINQWYAEANFALTLPSNKLH